MPRAEENEIRNHLELMAARLAHRGPDGSGFIVEDKFGMGSVRLAIIDIEGGKQPMSLPEESRSLVFNGEIYNYLELREELSADGVSFATRSDTEVLLNMLERDENECLEKANGIWAFASYEKKKRRLLLARDRLGVKPLYFAYRPGEIFAFASEIKALLALPRISAEVDQDALRQYLCLQLVMGEKTLFSGIRQVMPGECLEFHVDDTERFSRRRYWNIPTSVGAEMPDEQSCTDDLRDLLRSAIHLQLRSDAPVGSTLSGGLDSSVITLFAAAERSGSFPTFSGRFPDSPEYDEGRYIDAVLMADSKLKPQFTELRPQDFLDLSEKMVWYMDYPQAGPGLFSQMKVAQDAAKSVKVLLGGQGGDELFAGYVRYYIACLEYACAAVRSPNNAVPDSDFLSSTELSGNMDQLDNYLPLREKIAGAPLTSSGASYYWRLIERAPPAGVLRDEFWHKAPETVKALFDESFDRPDLKSLTDRMAHWDLQYSLPALLHVEDRSTMAFSLESRVPLLDHRLVEFAMRVPAALRFRKGRLKHLFLNGVRSYLPEPVANRNDKMGFPIPFTQWFRENPRLLSHVKETILESSFLADFTNRDRLASHLFDGNRYGRTWWAFYNLSLWARTFLGR